MTREQVGLAWERNRAMVRRRYSDLSEEDMQALEDLGAVPLPTGEVTVGPYALLTLLQEIKSLHGRLLAAQRRRKD